MKKKKLRNDWLQTSQWSFTFLRFGLISLYTVIFGRFPIPKKCFFWPEKWIFGTFLKHDPPSTWFLMWGCPTQFPAQGHCLWLLSLLVKNLWSFEIWHKIWRTIPQNPLIWDALCYLVLLSLYPSLVILYRSGPFILTWWEYCKPFPVQRPWSQVLSLLL